MGVGRFAFTPILPLMTSQTGLSAAGGASLATANYAGYLAGALAGSLAPGLIRHRAVHRSSLVLIVVTLAAMPLTHAVAAWLVLRLLAGVASAFVFVIAASALLSHLRGHPAHLQGWGLGGVGAGIALSGLLILILRPVLDWRSAWWATAGLATVLAAGAWALRPEPAGPPPADPPPADLPPADLPPLGLPLADLPLAGPPLAGPPLAGPPPAGPPPAGLPLAGLPLADLPPADPPPADLPPAAAAQRPPTRTHRWFFLLLTSYTLEGAGYIIAGTFLVAAIDQGSPGWLGTGAWILAGLAATASPALWAWLAHRWSRPGLLLAALATQAAGIALPALTGGSAAALAGSFLFGATFLGVATIALATGAHLRFPRSVALLTAGYSAGQILGPLAVTPLLHHGYHQALAVASCTVLAAAIAAGVLSVGFPHRMPTRQRV